MEVNQAKYEMLSYQYLWELFSIDADGDLVWKTPRYKKYIGRKVGYVTRKGYRAVTMKIKGKKYNFHAHRLLFMMRYGSWPKGEIDHLDGDPLNNRKENLRDATPSQNQRNQYRHRSGNWGVSFSKACGKWRVQFKYKSRLQQGGFFTSKQEAIAARDKLYKSLTS